MTAASASTPAKRVRGARRRDGGGKRHPARTISRIVSLSAPPTGGGTPSTLGPNYPPGRVRSAAMLQPYAAGSIACAIRQIVPACRGYAAHRWGHPSRVSRLARRRQRLTYSLRAPDRLRCHFDRCFVSPRGCAQGALLLATRPGQGSSQPWCRGAVWQTW